eukprot:536187_1
MSHDKTEIGGIGIRTDAHQVARGVLQWNAPYTQLSDELSLYGIGLTPSGMNLLQIKLAKKDRNTIKCTSRDVYRKQHMKKYKISDSYVGNGDAFFNNSNKN